MRRPTAGIGPRIVAVAGLCAAAGVTAAEKGNQQVSPFAGSFSTAIPLQVVPFHGIEPRISLGYSSEGRNGFVGVGWSLSGFSVIERTNAGRGSPRFDSNDAFMLDGQELIQCPSQSSEVRCQNGATHLTKIESFLKIVRVTSNDTFQVFGRDGTKTTFSPIMSATGGTLRWGQSSVVDTKGNTVTYGWACPTVTGATADCYPDSVSYNGFSVTFLRESRPDTLSFPAVSNIGLTLYRLKTILVKVGTTNVRALALAYTTSGVTGRSLLSSVQLYGKDVTISGSAVTAGTSLPAQTFTYQADSDGKKFLSPSSSSSSSQTTTVDYSTASGSALEGTDFTATAGTLTFTGSETTKTFTVNVTGETLAEHNETFLVNLSGAAGSSIGRSQAQATIVNDDGSPPSVSVSPVCVTSGNVTVTVADGPAGVSDKVKVFPTGAADTGFVDWWHLNGTQTAPSSGSSGANFQVAMPGAQGTYDFRFFDAGGQKLATSNVVTVGTCSGTPSVSIGDVSLYEGNSGTASANFTVSLSSASTQTVTVNWSTGNGTAASSSDYSAASGTLTFSPSETVKTVGVTVNGDTTQESHETFVVDLSSPSGATLGDSQGEATVLNDDGGTASISASLACVSPSAAVVVSFAGAPGNLTDWVGLYPTGNPDYVAWFSLNGTQSWPSSAILNGSFTANVPGTPGTYELKLRDATNGNAVATSGVMTVGACTPSLSVGDVSVVEGNADTVDVHFTIRLSAPASQIASVSYATAASSATQGIDYVGGSGAVTFFTGETAKTVGVTINGDATSEGNETFFLNLSNAVNATIADSQGQASILDDDGAATVTSASCVAPGGALTVSVTGGPANAGDDVRIYPSSGGSYADWWYLNGTKTLPPQGSADATFSVTVPTTAGNYELRLINYSTQAAIATSPLLKIGTCLPALSIGDVQIVEGDGGFKHATFTATLQPSSPQIVTADYATAARSAAAVDDFDAAQDVLTFNPGETSKNVVVRIGGDALVESTETFLVKLSRATNADIADGEGQATIVDDDSTPRVRGTPGSVSTSGTEAVQVTGGPGHAGDWVGVFPVGAGPSGYTNWWYLNGTQTMPGSGSANASFDVTMPTTAGDYEFRLISYTSGQAVATSNAICVGSCLPAIAIADVTLVEGNAGAAAARFRVTLSAASTQTVTVSYQTADGTGSGGSDYVSASGVLSFAAGETIKTLQVDVSGDVVPEPNETFLLNLSGAQNATIADSQAQANIVNDDGSASAIVAGPACVAASGSVVVTVIGAPGNLTDWVGLYPVGGIDYVAWYSLNGTQSWPSTPLISTSFAVSMPASANAYEFRLVDATNGLVAGTSNPVTVGTCSGTPAITLNDVTVTEGADGTTNALFTVSLSSGTSQTVTVDYSTSSGSAEQSSDFIAASGTLSFSGTTTKVVAVKVYGDTTVEGTESFFLTLSSPQNATLARAQGLGTIVNDDGAYDVLTALPTCVSGSGQVTASVSAGPGHPGDWVGLFPAGASNSGYLDWWHLNGTKTMPGAGLSSASFTVAMPPTQGIYELRLFAYGSVYVGTSAPISVGACSSLTVADVQVTEGNSGNTVLTFTVTRDQATADTPTAEQSCGSDQLLMGDFNGDGRTDQACYATANGGRTRVLLGAPIGFAPPETWLNGTLGSLQTADFNNDGRTDIASFDSSTGDFKVALSTGSVFQPPQVWGTSSSCSGTVQLGMGDFNGDGYPDVSCKNVAQSNVYVGLSNGVNGFTVSDYGNVQCDSGGERTGSLDFDGDGKDDWYCIGKSSGGSLTSWRNNGQAFASSEFTGLDSSFCAHDNYVFGDFSGDGRTDATCMSNGKVALSSGYGFHVVGTFGGWCSGSPHFFAGDFDGDGASEIVCDNTGSGTDDIQVRKFKEGGLASAETWKGSFCGGSLTGGDFNGDGKTDIYCNASTVAIAYAGTSAVMPDLMVAAANGLGGTTSVAYIPSTSFPSVNNPGPKYAVTSLTTEDGRGWSATTNYQYSGAFMDRKQRRFLGFRYIKEFKPCLEDETSCPVTETYLKQDHLASAGKPERVEQRDTAGRILSAQLFEYETTTTEPLKSQLSGTWSLAFDGSVAGCASWPCGTGKRSYVTHQYDAYGNVTQSASYGDYDTSGDETTTANSFVPSTSAYIVDRTAVAQVYAGIGTGGTKLQETRIHYDGNGFTQAPTAGYATQVDRWLKSATEDRFVTSTTTYDSHGNPTVVTDETTRSVTTAWDSTYHIFPVSVTNAVGEVATTSWDALCAVPATAQSPSQQGTSLETAYQTDELCRPSRTDFPLGGYQITSYVDLGDATAQHVKVETPPGGGSGDHYVKTYFDGLGRSYKTASRSASDGVDIVSTQAFNARGGVASNTAPYYSDASPETTTFSYDRWDRPVRTDLPDGNYRTVSYGLWSTTTTDENGKSAVSRRNLSSPLQSLQERFLGSTTVTTTSTTDLLGRLVAMEDHVGNDWSWTFDSLGRNLQKVDPDAGTWAFEYDDAGRLTSQTDAKSQETTFEYDDAGRLETKTNSAGTVTTEYSQARSSFYNTGLPTTVTSPSSVLKLDYDAEGKAVKQTRTLDSTDYVLSRTYDAGGFLRGITYPDGDAVGTTGSPLTYDAAGRLYGVPSILTSVTYNAAGQALVQTNANGTATTRAYSSTRGFLTDIDTLAGSTVIQNLQYTLDDAGLVTEVTSPFANEGWSYQYDDLYRLTNSTNTSTPAESQSWTYDEIGRITNNSRVGSYTYPSVGQPRPHAPLTAGSHSFTNYDANGNLVGGAGRTITWDADNRITQATVGATTTNFTYDAFGERLKKTTGADTTRYPIGDDYEIAPDGTVTKYVSIDGLGVVAKRVGPAASAATFWHHTDQLGSINAITDASGVEVFRKKYRPYGETLAQSGSNNESRGWIDQRNDGETGLTYLHARYYDPMLGFFMSPDPLGPAGGLNTYGYGPSDPVNGTDRTGLKWRICVGIDVDGYEGTDFDWQSCEEDFPEWHFVPNERTRSGSCGPEGPPCHQPPDCGLRGGQNCPGPTPPGGTPPVPPPPCPDCPPVWSPPVETPTPQTPNGGGPNGGSNGPPVVNRGFNPEDDALRPSDPSGRLRIAQGHDPFRLNTRPGFLGLNGALDRWAGCVQSNLRRPTRFLYSLQGSTAAYLVGSAPVHGGLITAGELTGAYAGGWLAPTASIPAGIEAGAAAGGFATAGALVVATGLAGYAVGTFGYCAVSP